MGRALLRQIGMDKMADMVQLHHHLNNLTQFKSHMQPSEELDE